MTQEQVAQAARVPVRVYQGYEYGEREPGARAIVRIANALDCDVKDLYPDDGE